MPENAAERVDVAATLQPAPAERVAAIVRRDVRQGRGRLPLPLGTCAGRRRGHLATGFGEHLSQPLRVLPPQFAVGLELRPQYGHQLDRQRDVARLVPLARHAHDAGFEVEIAPRVDAAALLQPYARPEQEQEEPLEPWRETREQLPLVLVGHQPFTRDVLAALDLVPR